VLQTGGDVSVILHHGESPLPPHVPGLWQPGGYVALVIQATYATFRLVLSMSVCLSFRLVVALVFYCVMG
jgi:hypothetical protein